MNRLTTIALAVFVSVSVALLVLGSGFLEGPGKCEKHVHSESLGDIRVDGIINSGAFSIVMMGNPSTRLDQVAIKVGVENDAGLEHDIEILRALNGSNLFPLFFGSGVTLCEKAITKRIVTYPYVVMEKLGNPVSMLKLWYPMRGTRLRQSLNVASQVLDGLESIHNLGYLMHDIHPKNVLLTTSSSASTEIRVKLVDFGEVMRLSDTTLPGRELNSLYTTVREDAGLPISQRDDLERVVYLILAVVEHNGVPWYSLEGQKRLESKAAFSFESFGSLYPPELSRLLHYARTVLEYGQPIDFDYCRNLLSLAHDSLTGSVV
jgi:serine/threonine protein kinase